MYACPDTDTEEPAQQTFGPGLRKRQTRSRSSMAKSGAAVALITDSGGVATAADLDSDSDSGIDSAEEELVKIGAEDTRGKTLSSRVCDGIMWPFYLLFITLPLG